MKTISSIITTISNIITVTVVPIIIGTTLVDGVAVMYTVITEMLSIEI